MHVEIRSLGWLFEIVIGLFIIFLCSLSLKKLIQKYREKFGHLQGWKFKLDWIVFPPLRLVLWMIAITYVINILDEHFVIFTHSSFFTHIQNAVIIFALAWVALRWKNVKQDELLERCKFDGKLDPATIQIIFKFSTIAIGIFALLIIFQIFEVNVIPLLAFGGIGAAAIGLAAKDVIANFFGGFMLLLLRPFVEGDKISIHQEKIEGYIEKIGWSATILRDKNKCPVSLPNALFSKVLIINHSRMSHRPIDEVFYFRYEDAVRIQEFAERLQKTISTHPDVDAREPILMGVQTCGQNSLHFNIRLYTRAINDTDFTRARQEILLKIYAFFRENDFEMSLPTQVIKICQE